MPLATCRKIARAIRKCPPTARLLTATILAMAAAAKSGWLVRMKSRCMSHAISRFESGPADWARLEADACDCQRMSSCHCSAVGSCSRLAGSLSSEAVMMSSKPCADRWRDGGLGEVVVVDGRIRKERDRLAR
jgi:hypothetical protein